MGRGGMDTQASLSLDSSNFDANMKKSEDRANATARAVAKAAREAAQARAISEKYAGDAVSEQSLREVAARKSASSAAVDYAKVQGYVKKGYLDGADGARVEAAVLQRLKAEKLAVAAASEVQAKAEEHTAVSQRMAASAAVRGLESGNVGIRSVENFLTTIPGVGKALQTVFPLLGAAALVAMVGELVVKFVEARKEAELLARKIQDGFRDEHLAAATATDELRLHNDQLQNAIDKLEHKPQNNLKIELDENIIAVDNLAKGAIEAQKRVKALLEQNKVGMLAQLMGSGSTAVVAGSVNAYRQDLSDLAFTKSEQVRSGDSAGAEATEKALNAKRKSYAEWLNSQISMRTGKLQGPEGVGLIDYSKVYGDQGANLSILRGERIDLRDDSEASTERARTGPLQGRKTADESQRSGEEASRKADEARFKMMEAHVAEWKTLAPVNAKAIYDYWDAQRNALAVGSSQYNSIIEKQASLAEEGARKASESIKRFLDENKRIGEERSRLPQNPMGAWQRDDQRAAADARDAANEKSAQDARNTARQAELLVQEAAGRTMTRIDAATELATIHTREYGAELFRLQERLKAVQTDPSLTSGADDKQRKIDELQKQISQVQANRGVQVLQDQFGIRPPDSSALVGASDAIREFVDSTRDAAREMKDLVSSTLNGLNRTIVTELTSRSRQGPRHLWTNLGKDLATNVTGTALEKGEGSLLSMLHLGGKNKPTGSAGDPIWVKLAGGSSGGFKGLGDAGLPGGKDGDSGGGGGLSAIGSILGSFVPGFASGIDGFSGGMAVVGERGPELVNLPRGASVIPNDRINGSGQSSGDMHFHVDARGSSDPAQTQAAVQRGIAAAAPHIVAASQYRSREAVKRYPSSRRG